MFSRLMVWIAMTPERRRVLVDLVIVLVLTILLQLGLWARRSHAAFTWLHVTNDKGELVVVPAWRK